MTTEELKDLEKLLRKLESEQANEIMKKHNIKSATIEELSALDDYTLIIESCNNLLFAIKELKPKT